jgi:hypothetical protein
MAWINYASRLREELSLRAASFALNHALPHECTIGSKASVIFREAEDGSHGNFYPSSFRRIQAAPEWKRRLLKTHTSASRRLVSHDRERRELDTAVSSDALLMSVFCHPKAFAADSYLRGLLNSESPERLEFGHNPRIPLITNHIECTEADLKIGKLLVEAKLTEGDFQCAPASRVERYRDFETVFETIALPRTTNRGYLHYQLIRGVLAAFAQQDTRFCLICDARRPDLVESWFAVASAVKAPLLRSRLQLVTWQELAGTLPKAVQKWLAEKYGIVACPEVL